MSSLYGDSLTAAIAVAAVRLARTRGDVVRRGRLEPRQLERATDFMTARLSKRIRLGELAAITGLSQAHFGRAFKASTGVAPHRWLLEARITRAQRLLLDTDFSLAQVAIETGFSEQSHFTRVFRSVVGTPPGAWRRRWGT
jgi:AraC family transcriptional regulator